MAQLIGLGTSIIDDSCAGHGPTTSCHVWVTALPHPGPGQANHCPALVPTGGESDPPEDAKPAQPSAAGRTTRSAAGKRKAPPYAPARSARTQRQSGQQKASAAAKRPASAPASKQRAATRARTQSGDPATESDQATAKGSRKASAKATHASSAASQPGSKAVSEAPSAAAASRQEAAAPAQARKGHTSGKAGSSEESTDLAAEAAPSRRQSMVRPRPVCTCWCMQGRHQH